MSASAAAAAAEEEEASVVAKEEAYACGGGGEADAGVDLGGVGVGLGVVGVLGGGRVVLGHRRSQPRWQGGAAAAEADVRGGGARRSGSGDEVSRRRSDARGKRWEKKKQANRFF